MEEIYIAFDHEDWPATIDLCARLREERPDQPEGYSWGTMALLRASRHDEAEALCTAAVERLPADHLLLIQYADSATRREQWTEARRRWTLVHERFPDQTDGVYGLMELDILDRYRELDAGATMTEPAAAPAPEVVIPAEREFLFGFESIGDNCEFGVVQRMFGAEPLGLLRWASISPTELLALLESRFEGVGLLENTVVYAGDGGEYVASDKRYFTMHTFLNQSEYKEDKVHRLMCRRLVFLKDKLIQDLSEGQKILVYKKFDNTLSDSQAVRIWQAIRQYGGGRLLCVRPAGRGRPAGRVVMAEDGLMHGYLKELTSDPHAARAYLGPWLDLCRQAARLSSAAGIGAGAESDR